MTSCSARYIKNLKEELERNNELSSDENIDEVLEKVKELINDKLRILYTKCGKPVDEKGEGESRSRPSGALVTISPASLYLAAKTFAAYYVRLNKEDRKRFEKDKDRVDNLLRMCVEAALPLSRLWNESVRRQVEGLMKCAFEQQGQKD